MNPDPELTGADGYSIPKELFILMTPSGRTLYFMSTLTLESKNFAHVPLWQSS